MYYVDLENLVNLLRLLAFVKGLDFETDFLGNTAYRHVVFHFQDF
jgi:hypothetical protein